MRPTAEAALRSFVDVPPESDFPIQNLPYGVFMPAGGPAPHVGAAIGAWVLDLTVLERRGVLAGLTPPGRGLFDRPALNALLALGPSTWQAVRARIQHLLRHDVPTLRDDAALRGAVLRPAESVQMCVPCAIGDYTDFYASREHATNVGRIFRGPDAALPPNYLHLPIGYHGRASSIVVSGTTVRRPCGQSRGAGRDSPEFGATRELDFELELGFVIGPGNALGAPIPASRAREHIFGIVLVNDWSARDIQQWEYAPLGPFLGKNFATSISPWVVPLDALAPFWCQGPVQDPLPLEHLRIDEPQALDIRLATALQTARQPDPHVLSRTNARYLYWRVAQMVAHHTVGGCNLRPGDLLASGTISGPTPDSAGSLLELAGRGAHPVKLPSGEERVFLQDGDTVVLRGSCDGPGYHIGLGECRGQVLPARVERV